ncbi:MAG: hypothetical protein QM775_04225 [Pirellulales bacterium]
MIMTSLVLLAGFGSLQISEMPTTKLFSLLACVTIFAAVVGDLLLLPPMLRLFAKVPVARGAAVTGDGEPSTSREALTASRYVS